MTMIDIQITDQDLPVLSAVATQALQLINDDRVTNRQIEDLIRQDPSLTQRLLTTANSPFYSGRYEIKSIADSITRMGLRQLRNIVLVAATGELFKGDDPVMTSLWNHSIATAVASHQIAGRVAGANPEEAFIAGMLHDMGKVVVYRQHTEIYSEAIADANAEGRRLHEIETERFEFFTHMSVGGLVIKKWKLADQIADAARFHHELERGAVPILNDQNYPAIVAVASGIINNMNIGTTDEEFKVDVCSFFASEFLKIDEIELESLTEKIAESLEQQAF